MAKMVKFSRFFREVSLFWYLRTDSQSFVETSFLILIGQTVYFILNIIFYIQDRISYIFFGNFVIWFSWKKVWKENHYDTWLPILIIMSGKVLRFYFIVKDPIDWSDCRILENPKFHERVEA